MATTATPTSDYKAYGVYNYYDGTTNISGGSITAKQIPLSRI
jgi:hypothetical protein